MRNLAAFVAIICGLLTIQQPAAALDANEKESVKQSRRHFRVDVKVLISEPFGSEVSSYINRELRSLGDVTVTEDKPDYRVYITGLEVHNKAGDKVGYAYSLFLTTTLDVDLLRTIISNRLSDHLSDKEIESALSSSLSYLTSDGINYERRMDANTFIAGPDGVREACGRIVVYIDSGTLERDRRDYQKAIDSLLNSEDSK